MIIDRKFDIEARNPFNGNTYNEGNSFLICAKDKAAPAALRAYIDECKRLGANEGHLESCTNMLHRVEEFQKNIDSRVPDTVGTELEHCLRKI